MIRIAFGHKSRSGKDTACDYICENYNAHKYSFAGKLYEFTAMTQEFFDKPVEKDRVLLQTMGEFFRRHYGNDIWVNMLKRRVIDSEGKNIVISDLRYKNEALALKEMGFVLVKINRESRVIDRDPNHISEVDLNDYIFDYVIENSGTISQLYKKIDMLLEELKNKK